MSEAESDFEWQTQLSGPCLDLEVDSLAEPTVFKLFDWTNEDAWIEGHSVDLEAAR